jgi:hypothetical protein
MNSHLARRKIDAVKELLPLCQDLPQLGQRFRELMSKYFLTTERKLVKILTVRLVSYLENLTAPCRAPKIHNPREVGAIGQT